MSGYFPDDNLQSRLDIFPRGGNQNGHSGEEQQEAGDGQEVGETRPLPPPGDGGEDQDRNQVEEQNTEHGDTPPTSTPFIEVNVIVNGISFPRPRPSPTNLFLFYVFLEF